MRIYNRDQSAILGARNNRLAKMRAFSSSTKTRASSKGTTQSAPKSKNYRTSAWMQFLNQFQNGTAVSGDKIVENQKKSYDYEITGLAAERVETHMKRFLEEGKKIPLPGGRGRRKAAYEGNGKFCIRLQYDDPQDW